MLSLRACWPLRMRVSISPRGSVIAIRYNPLPARLDDAGNEALVGQLPEHDPRQAELAVISTRPAGQLAAVANPGRIPIARELRHLQTRDQALGLVLRLIVRDRLQLRVLGRILLDELLAPLVLVDRTQFRHDLSSSPIEADTPSGGLLLLLLREGEIEQAQQLARLFIRLRRGGYDDVHSPDLVDLVVVDLGEDDLRLEAERIIAAAVERLGIEPAEVANARKRDRHQTIEELVHALAAKRDLAADWHAFAQLELSDRLLCLGDHRLLA